MTENEPQTELEAEEYRGYLRDSYCLATILKKSTDEVRKLYCTLKEEELPVVEVSDDPPKRKRTPNPKQVSVWDLEKNAWRSFMVDTVISFEILAEKPVFDE